MWGQLTENAQLISICSSLIWASTKLMSVKSGFYYTYFCTVEKNCMHCSCYIYNYGQSFFPGTPQPHLDHTYSCTSHDSSNTAEGVHVGTQMGQPVIHAETQTHDMVGYYLLFNNATILLSVVFSVVSSRFSFMLAFISSLVLYTCL